MSLSLWLVLEIVVEGRCHKCSTAGTEWDEFNIVVEYESIEIHIPGTEWDELESPLCQ